MDEPARPAKNNQGRKIIAAMVFLFLAVIGGITVYFYLRYKNTHITTDDAFIEGHIHTVASKVPGTVKAVNVKSNQFVKKGEVLVELDTADYDVKVSEASSALNAEKGKIAEIDTKIEVARRQLAEAMAKADAIKAIRELQEANLEQAQKDRERAENLYKKDAFSRERYEKAETGYKVALAQVKAAAEGLKNMLAGVEAQKAVVRQAESARATQAATVKQREATVDAAKLNYGYTKIFAQAEGYVTKKNVEVGNQLQPGQPVMAIVSLEDIHVIANYKETQLEKVRAGQRVEIKVDTYPGKPFRGTVDSIMTGTGAAFSLFPPENATGNFVKVVQRIPVKIVLEQNTDPQHMMRLGMSVEPTIIIE